MATAAASREPVEDEVPDLTPVTPAVQPATSDRKSRKVITDDRLAASNDIMRILSDLEPAERKSVMQIVNILVETPITITPEESE